MKSEPGRAAEKSSGCDSLFNQPAVIACQFFWFPWYNVVITDVTAFVAGLVFYLMFISQVPVVLGWFVSLLLLFVAIIAALV
jgi:hypothetical protein